MISVKNISKWYGSTQALKDISFEVKKGEIVGLLGPNGAGKSTTMKLLTGYMFPTEGDITINGEKTSENSLETRAMIGYLPENNPLYMDFTVEETLLFHASMRELKGKKLTQAIRKTVRRCGLEDVFYSPVHTLSKGYRQRVGLATAILHEPKILILDEPTSGLDPRQIIEIRELLQELGKEHTIIFSTHIMQEVEAVCNRIIIINEGMIVAEGTPETLGQNKEGFTTLSLKTTLSAEDAQNEFEKEYTVIESKRLPDKTTEIILQIENDIETRQTLLKFIVKNKIPMLALVPQESNLEKVFLQLTK
ncbi:MAG: ABC transporter ATP-binding protein [Candidatus Gracilibacteria bacterium]